MDMPFPPRPDFSGGSLANLMASISLALGGPGTGYPPLRALPVNTLADDRVIVLLVIDGLGAPFVREHGGAMADALVGGIDALFPATTATGIPTFLTGVPAQQHGFTGWHMHLRELGGVYAVLPAIPRAGGNDLGATGLDPAAYFSAPPLTAALPVESWMVAPREIARSYFNSHHLGPARLETFDTLDAMCREIASAALRSRGRAYVYAYWPEFDRICHQHGAASAEAVSHYRQLDEAVGALRERIAGLGARLLITADHGFIDRDPNATIELADHPAIARELVLPLCGEPRVAFCYLRPGREDQFLAAVRGELGDLCDCLPSAGLLAEGYFGLGPVHPGLAARIGDYTLVMKGRAVIRERLPCDRNHMPLGVHGGVHPREREAPLISFQP